MNKTVITNYTIKSNVVRQLTLAHISDLHEINPSETLSLLSSISPDLILVTGDMFERNKEDSPTNVHVLGNPDVDSKKSNHFNYGKLPSAFMNIIYCLFGKYKQTTGAFHTYQFFEEASKIAPVYYSFGNHECYLYPKDEKILKENHITLLDNRDVEVEIKGQKLLIGGLSTCYDLEWLKNYSKKEDGYKILLTHHPEYYEHYIKGQCDSFDLILSGHVHGGQWRILGQGILAPGQGFFPKYHHGIYPTARGNLIVSAGLANTAKIPRFGNPCEVVCIKI